MNMRNAIRCLAILLCMPLFAHAAYKCKQPDGSMSFQDVPCAPDAVGAKTALQPVQSINNPSYSGAMSRPSQRPQSTTQSKSPDNAQAARYQKEMQAQLDEMKARNKQQQCEHERQQLNVVKTQRPIYTTDNNGDRHYVDDDKLAATLAEHQQRVADACN